MGNKGLITFKNQVLRKRFSSRREGVVGASFVMKGFEVDNAVRNIISVIRFRGIGWAEVIVRMGEIRNACIILVGKPDGKMTLGRLFMNWRVNTTVP
jgi:hypothetical protein